MRSITVVVLLAALAASGACADKITVDPNAAPRTISASLDKRLDQNVTYQGGYKRLHAVTDELSGMTGVTIRCGSNNQDWQVRDVPVFVYVKDMPLGRLLGTMAVAAHAALSICPSEPGKANALPIYILSRDKANGKAITAALREAKSTMRELAAWSWDALAGISARGADLPKGVKPAAAVVGRVLAALGPGARAKVLAGQRLTFKAGDVLPADLLNELVTLAGTMPQDSFGRLKAATLTQAEMERLDLIIKLWDVESSRSDNALRIVLPVPIEQKVSRRSPDDPSVFIPATMTQLMEWCEWPIKLAKGLESVEELGLPAAPDMDAALRNRLKPGPGLMALAKDKDWDLPMLREKARVKLPGDRGLLSQCDALAALAETNGLNIVCEDFVSHKWYYVYPAGMDFGEDATVADVLRKLEKRPSKHGELLYLSATSRDELMKGDEKAQERCQFRWFVNEEQRLLMAWINKWPEHHSNLAPESILANLHSKCAGSGAELDDVTPVLQLTQQQFAEWVDGGRDLPLMSGPLSLREGPWAVYSTLSPSDKELAKSTEGLPLADLGPTRVAKRVLESGEQAEGNRLMMYEVNSLAQLRHEQALLCDPAFLRTATMRVTSEPVDSWYVVTPGLGWPKTSRTSRIPGKMEKHRYLIEVTGRSHGEQVKITAKWENLAFPAYTSEREAEVRAEAEKKASE